MNAPEILEWSAWVQWDGILSRKIEAPDQPGVYEARHRDQEIRLHIGETNLLKRRVSVRSQTAFWDTSS